MQEKAKHIGYQRLFLFDSPEKEDYRRKHHPEGDVCSLRPIRLSILIFFKENNLNKRLFSRTSERGVYTDQPSSKPSVVERIKTMENVYTVEYYSLIKNNKITLFSGKQMELEMTLLNKISQTYKNEYHMFFSHVQNLYFKKRH